MKGPGREWDYIIVGGGTAGCVLAARLSENGATKVLLLEAGGEYSATLSIPLAGLRRIHTFSWQYATRQQPGLANRRISLPVGKILGGSSSTNAMMYFRGTPESYAGWAGPDGSGWSFGEMLPYFRRSERYENGGSPERGGAGPMHVSVPRHRAPFSTAFVEACVEAGIPRVEDFHDAVAEGTGFYQVTQRRGRRETAASSYLAPTRLRPNLTVETRASVWRLNLRRGRAVSVDYFDRNGEHRRAMAGREIILCSGALNSPKILMVSGIGPPDHLRSLGIKVLHPLSGVGRKLQDHVRIPVIYESGRVSPGAVRHWVRAAVDYAVRRKGVLTSNCCESGAIIRATPDAPFPDLQLVSHFQTVHHPRGVDLQFCLLRTASRGSVTLASNDPFDSPCVDPNYLSDPADVKLALDGIRWARTLARTSALRSFPLGAEIMPGTDRQSAEQLEAYCRATADTCFHPAGTCKMGAGPDAVVDYDLRVHGLEGLRVVDASIMPELPNGNTCAATLMIAEKAVHLIKNSNSAYDNETRGASTGMAAECIVGSGPHRRRHLR